MTALSRPFALASQPLSKLASFVAAETTGVLWLRAADERTNQLRIELVRGWVHALLVVASPAGPEELMEAARNSRSRSDAGRGPHAGSPEELLGGMLAALAHLSGTSLVEADEPRARLGSVTPFHPHGALRAAARAAVKRLRSQGATPDWAAFTDDTTLSSRARLHASAIAPDEERAVQLLAASPPLLLSTLRARAGCAPSRLDDLLAELAVLGSLVIVIDGEELRVEATLHASEAEATDRRRAYHAAARQTHPDLHPDADDETRQRLNDEMAALAARHRGERK